MPFDLTSGTTVNVELPQIPTLQVSFPGGPSTTAVAVVLGPPGPPGPQGPIGPGFMEFTYQQTIPQAVWTVNHRFGRYPVAWSLYDTDLRLCAEYSVEQVDTNTCLVSMDVPTAGVIRLI